MICRFIRQGVLLLCGIGLWAQADAAQDSIRMNLDQVLATALTESPAVRIADRDVEVKRSYEKEQLAALLPSVAASGTYNRTLKKQVMAMSMNGQTTRIAVGTDNSWSGGVSLSLPLVAPALWKTAQMSAQDVELAMESARSSRIGLIAQVKKAYYAVLLAQDSYKVLEQSYRNAQLNAEYVDGRFRQGLASEFEKLRADVQVKNALPNLLSAESAVQLASMQLKVLMGLDVNEPVIFEGSLADYETDMLNSAASLTASDLSLESNASLRQLALQTEQLESAIRVLKAAYLPTLSLSASYMYTALNDNFKFGDYQWNPYSVLALSLNIPIYSGSTKLHKIKQQRLTLQNLADTRSDLERSLQLGLDNSLTDIRNAVETLASNKETVAMAEKAYSISRKQYEVGMNTLLELNDAELALTQSRLAETQSVYAYMSACADLEQLLGTTARNE
ncbi:MAG: TolC family protein [Bacteroidales bacterium]|nr:TolC family protein [Bacteroidales bacterium]